MMQNKVEFVNWYALYVLTGHEEKVRRGLEKNFGENIKAVVPKRVLRERKRGKWHIVRRILFPGYVLLIGDVSIETFYQISKLPFFLTLLRDKEGPLKINKKEIEVLKTLIDNESAEIGISKAYKEGDKVKILEGPLVGLGGYIQSFNSRKGRAEIAIDFLGSSRSIQVGIEFIEKI